MTRKSLPDRGAVISHLVMIVVAGTFIWASWVLKSTASTSPANRLVVGANSAGAIHNQNKPQADARPVKTTIANIYQARDEEWSAASTPDGIFLWRYTLPTQPFGDGLDDVIALWYDAKTEKVFYAFTGYTIDDAVASFAAKWPIEVRMLVGEDARLKEIYEYVKDSWTVTEGHWEIAADPTSAGKGRSVYGDFTGDRRVTMDDFAILYSILTAERLEEDIADALVVSSAHGLAYEYLDKANHLHEATIPWSFMQTMPAMISFLDQIDQFSKSPHQRFAMSDCGGGGGGNNNDNSGGGGGSENDNSGGGGSGNDNSGGGGGGDDNSGGGGGGDDNSGGGGGGDDNSGGGGGGDDNSSGGCVGDIDCDGIDNGDDPDVDGDGIDNGDDPDVDGDGIDNGDDPDVDSDGINNGDDPDVDGDGIDNGDDPDVDGDGISNGDDPDVDGDGISNGDDPDVDGDGISNGDDRDIDGDGISNDQDDDMDGDGIPNDEDDDMDGDGIPNDQDDDADGDGIPDDEEGDGIDPVDITPIELPDDWWDWWDSWDWWTWLVTGTSGSGTRMAMGNRPNDTINGAAVVYMAHWYDDFANGNKRFVTDIDPCDDGDPCTSDECDLELGCLHFPKNCSDGDLCTTDTCDSSNGECHHNMPAGQECCHWDGLIFHHDDLYDPTLRCCGPNGVVPKLPISDLSDCPNRVDNPNASPTTNGCGPGWTPVPECPMCVPYGIIPTQDCTGCFLGACDYHDFCYATCNSNKPQCDYNFAANMHQICDQYYSWNPIWKTECHDKASLYDGAVSSWGDKSYDQGQKEACQCCE